MVSGPIKTLGELVVEAAKKTPESEAVIFPSERRTFGELAEQSLKHAARFQKLGLRPGDHIGILLPNCIEYIELMLGAACAGLVSVNLNARYKSAELNYVVENSDIRLLFTTREIDEHVDFCALLADSFPDLRDQESQLARLNLVDAPLLERIFVFGETPFQGLSDFTSFENAADTPLVNPVRQDHDAPVIMMYTSGTTANPKGCRLSHRALVGNGFAMADRFELTDADRFWDALPLFHMSTVLPITACLATRATFICMEHFEPGAALNQMEAERATIAFTAFPTLMNALLEHPSFADRNLSSIRLINNVAPVDTLLYFQSCMPQAKQVSAYGLTEAGGVVSYGSPRDSLEERTTACGRPFDGIEVRIEDPETRSARPAGEVGEILIRGYCLFEGYYKDADKTRETVDERGWLHTGDFGCLTENGMISYRGRLKDMLKVGGENVAALEIESFLNTHPDVVLSQVVGVDDDRLVEVPAAFVECREGATVNASDLVEYCNGQISSFKIPRYIVFVDAWPMSATKVQKFKLKDLPLGNRVYR